MVALPFKSVVDELCQAFAPCVGEEWDGPQSGTQGLGKGVELLMLNRVRQFGVDHIDEGLGQPGIRRRPY